MAHPERPVPHLRIGTQQREAAMRVLGEHLSTGHLDVTEYIERVDRAVAARTVGELDALFADLPGAHQPPPPPVYPAVYPAVDRYGLPLSDKSKVVAGVLQLVLPFGVGRFYTGHTGMGVAQLLLSLLCGVGVVWCLVDGVLILVQGGTDGNGRRLRSS